MDTDHPEAADMWDFNATNLHPLRNQKDSIAEYVMNGTNKVKSSIPNGTFKNQLYPNSMKVLNYNQFAEPDSQPVDQTLSPLEYAGLMNVRHMLPAGVERHIKPHTYTAGLDDSVVRRGRWKTSHGAKTKNVKYAPYQRTGTSMHTAKGARSNRGRNRGIMATGPDDDFLTSEFRSAAKPAEHAILNKRVATAAFNVAMKWSSGKYPNKASMLADEDVNTILRAGIDFTDPHLIAQIAQTTGVSAGVIGAGLRAVFAIISRAQGSGQKDGSKDDNVKEDDDAVP